MPAGMTPKTRKARKRRKEKSTRTPTACHRGRCNPTSESIPTREAIVCVTPAGTYRHWPAFNQSDGNPVAIGQLVDCRGNLSQHRQGVDGRGCLLLRRQRRALVRLANGERGRTPAHVLLVSLAVSLTLFEGLAGHPVRRRSSVCQRRVPSHVARCQCILVYRACRSGV